MPGPAPQARYTPNRLTEAIPAPPYYGSAFHKQRDDHLTLFLPHTRVLPHPGHLHTDTAH